MNDNIWPEKGKPAIIIANHTSYFDGIYLALKTPQKITFGVDTFFATHFFFKNLLLLIGKLKKCDMVPMEPKKMTGVRSLVKVLNNNGWVCLFPEGGINTGLVYEGARWLSEKTGAPIHSIHLKTIGLWKVKIILSASCGKTEKTYYTTSIR